MINIQQPLVLEVTVKQTTVWVNHNKDKRLLELQTSELNVAF